MSIFCQCCLNKCDDQVNMSSQVNNQGILEIYEEMLQYSTGIQLLKDGNIHYICKTCICKLQEYCIFKNQVEESQWRLSINALKMQIKREPSYRPNCEVSSSDDDSSSSSSSESDSDDMFSPLNKPAKMPLLKKLKCPKCTAIFYNKEEHELHTQSCNTSFICPHCGKTFDTSSKFSGHLTTHKKKVQCEICSKLIGENRINSHINSIHNGRLMYRCAHCPERFNDNRKKHKHMVKVHGAEPQVYPCHLCSRVFGRPFGRTLHIRRTHLKEKNERCSICKISFFDKATLTEHMLVHTGERKYECDFCHKRYGRRDSLKVHLLIHYNIRNHKCRVCGMAFRQKGSLTSHSRTHR